MVHPMGTGWGNSCRHTHARQACRGLQRFVKSRVRRDLPPRRQGRGFGWQRLPHSQRYALGLASMGSGLLEYTAQPAHGGRGRLSDRRTREHCTYGGMGRAWCTDDDGAREALPWGNPQQRLGVV